MMPFCKGNTDVPHVCGSMCVLCKVGRNGGKFGKIRPQLLHELSEVKAGCRRGKERERETEPSIKEKSAFRKPHMITGFVHLYRIMYISDICIKKYILSECLSKEGKYISL